MFNTTNSNHNSSVTFNAPATGIIQKSSEKSFFARMHQNSKLSECIFDDKSMYGIKEVIVLQVLLTHEGYFLVELINKEDLEKKVE